MKKILSILTVLAVALTLTGCGSKKNNQLKFGTGGEGGNYYSYGTNLAKLTKDEDIKLKVTKTAGSASNIRLLSQGYLDLALVQSDVYEDAINDGQKGFHIVTGLYDETCQIVVLQDSQINSVRDLLGKKVSLGEKDSGAYKNATEILDFYNIKEDKVQAEYLSYADAMDKLANKELDAVFCTASYPTTSIVNLANDHSIRLLPIDASLATSNSAYKSMIIKAGTYAGQTEDINTIGVTAILAANDSLDKDTEKTILEVLKKHNQEIQDISFGVKVQEDKAKGTYKLSLDMYLTLALAVLVLYLGSFLKKKIKFLDTFCVPAPVVGGLIFAVLACILYATKIVEFVFDESFKTICMIIFFTSVGFQANLKVLKKGGAALVVFLLCVVALIFCQNSLAIGLSKVLNINPYVGLCTGSIPMVGGHGTAGAFGLVLEDLGQSGATTLCTAAATFGLIMGSLMGGPIGRRLITKKDLLKTVAVEDASILVEDEKKHHRKASMYAPAAYQIAIAMGLGTIVSVLLSKTGMTFPVYIGGMIVAAFMRNIGEYTKKYTVHMGEINDIGGICLSLFLGIAMITLKLWQLTDLALPLLALLGAQTIFMALFSYFVVFNVMGRNYDAAVLSAGTCGFGMGATPNAMANMQAITDKYAPSFQAYLLVPIVGSMFADFINSLVITLFINII